ncbi:MAG: ribosomal protein S18-alanine N-acetyltransferase [Bacilli bacterium]|nr:ribosomal protein S18-alanine N-acetyltransferase [Bacilli bacterium]
MKYEVRPMVVDDIESIIEGETKIFGESLGYDMLYTELKLNPYAYYFVLDIDKKVSGYIGVWIEEDHSEIINFYIDKEYQNEGFGQMLLSFVIELVKSTGINNLSLEVRESNKKAIHIYEKFGFKYSHTRENYYKDHENASVMILEVSKC